MDRINLNKRLLNKYHHSIKVHNYEAQNQHQLKFPLSDLTDHFIKFSKTVLHEVNLKSCFTMFTFRGTFTK